MPFHPSPNPNPPPACLLVGASIAFPPHHRYCPGRKARPLVLVEERASHPSPGRGLIFFQGFVFSFSSSNSSRSLGTRQGHTSYPLHAQCTGIGHGCDHSRALERAKALLVPSSDPVGTKTLDLPRRTDRSRVPFDAPLKYLVHKRRKRNLAVLRTPHPRPSDINHEPQSRLR